MLHGCSLMVMGQHRRYLSIKATGAHSTLQAHWFALPGTAYAPLVAQPVAQDTTGTCAVPATLPPQKLALDSGHLADRCLASKADLTVLSSTKGNDRQTCSSCKLPIVSWATTVPETSGG